jgi:hypothetical protein
MRQILRMVEEDHLRAKLYLRSAIARSQTNGEEAG